MHHPQMLVPDLWQRVARDTPRPVIIKVIIKANQSLEPNPNITHEDSQQCLLHLNI